MPHMANLSWMSFFMLFNMTLLMVFFSINFNSTTLTFKKNFNTKINKKWQW